MTVDIKIYFSLMKLEKINIYALTKHIVQHCHLPMNKA